MPPAATTSLGPRRSPRLSTMRQPGLERDEDTKRELDRRDRPAMGLVDGVNEKRPTVLQVGDQYHAQDAANELSPACCCNCARSGFNSCCRHSFLPGDRSAATPRRFVCRMQSGLISHLRSYVASTLVCV